MVMSIFIILRLVQCTCFALYVLWNKWSTVMVEWFLFQSEVEECMWLSGVSLHFLLTAAGMKRVLKYFVSS